MQKRQPSWTSESRHLDLNWSEVSRLREISLCVLIGLISSKLLSNKILSLEKFWVGKKSNFWMRQEDFKSCEISSKSKISASEPSFWFVTRLFLCILHWLEGMIWLCGQETVWAKSLNHQSLSYWPKRRFLVVIFQFYETVYSQTLSQWLNVLIFYFRICYQKRYPHSLITI